MTKEEATEWAAHMNSVGMPARRTPVFHIEGHCSWDVWARHTLHHTVQECQAAIGRHVVGK